MTHDFSDHTPPHQIVLAAFGRCFVPPDGVAMIARWGAEQAAERLKGQWPTPITDRRPTGADGDESGYVQFQDNKDRWLFDNWRTVAHIQRPWRHTPRWQPPTPPPLTPEQQKAMAALDHILRHASTNEGEAIIRRMILGCEA